MRKTWIVMRREFIERVRTRWFVITTVLGPLIMIAFIVVPIMLARRGTGERSVAVMDLTTTGFGGRLTGALDASKAFTAVLVPSDPGRAGATADSLTQLVGAHAVDGFLIVSDATADSGRVEYRGANVSLYNMQVLSTLLDDAVFAERLGREGVDPSLVRRAKIRVNLKTAKITGERTTNESAQGAFILAYAMWLLTYTGILLYGIQVMGSVVEEKTSRIVEVLVSSMRPFELMTGKVVGVGAVGLFQFLIWGAFAALVVGQGRAMLWQLGVGPDATGDVTLPTISLATIAVFVTFFLLGYFLYAAMFAAVGAMTNSEAEARQAANVVVMLLVVPMLFMIGVLSDPGGTLAVRLSFIPFSAPMAMPVRWAASEVSGGELLGSVALLLATVLAITWVAARIYRVGILMYGKRPTLHELVRWVRASA